MKAFYSPGITRYEIWNAPDDPERLMILYVGTQREQIARSYKIRITKKGRLFVQPNGRRIYLDQCLKRKG